MSSRPRPTVLVVDDYAEMVDMLVFILRRLMRLRVVTAKDSLAGLRLARRRKFDLATTDIRRSGMNGLMFLRAFKHLQPATPVIVISGALDEVTARRARRLRAHDCLCKGFEVYELVEMVRAAIASRKVCRTVLRSWRRRLNIGR